MPRAASDSPSAARARASPSTDNVRLRVAAPGLARTRASASRRPADFDQHLAQQFRRGLDRHRKAQRGRQLLLGLARRLCRICDRPVAAAGRQLDQRRNLPLHDCNQPDACRLPVPPATGSASACRASSASDGLSASRRADADREQFVDVAEIPLVGHQVPAAGLDDVARAHRGQFAQRGPASPLALTTGSISPMACRGLLDSVPVAAAGTGATTARDSCAWPSGSPSAPRPTPRTPRRPRDPNLPPRATSRAAGRCARACGARGSIPARPGRRSGRRRDASARGPGSS